MLAFSKVLKGIICFKILLWYFPSFPFHYDTGVLPLLLPMHCDFSTGIVPTYTCLSGTAVPTLTWELWLCLSGTGAAPIFTLSLWLCLSGTVVVPTFTLALRLCLSGARIVPTFTLALRLCLSGARIAPTFTLALRLCLSGARIVPTFTLALRLCLSDARIVLTFTLALWLCLWHWGCSYFHLATETLSLPTKDVPTSVWAMWPLSLTLGLFLLLRGYCDYHSDTGVVPTFTWALWLSRSGTVHASL